MTDEDIIKKIEAINKVVCVDLRDDITREIATGFAMYRTNFVKADGNWCCARMRRIAAEVFHLNRPSDQTFNTTLSILDLPMVYCPFCGVKLS